METEYISYLGPNKALYLRNRSSGKHIRNQRPVVLRFKVIRLRKEGFVHIEGPVIFMVFVPFVLRIVYLIVHRRSCKVELRRNSAVSPDSPMRGVTHLIWGDPYNVTWSASIFPLKERQGEGTVFLMKFRAQG